MATALKSLVDERLVRRIHDVYHHVHLLRCCWVGIDWKPIWRIPHLMIESDDYDPSGFSDEDLDDVFHAIDRERFPDRFALIQKEIERRKERNGAFPVKPEGAIGGNGGCLVKFLEITSRIRGVFFLIGAIFALVRYVTG